MRVSWLIAVVCLAAGTGRAEALNNTVGAALPTALGQVRSQSIATGDVAYFGYVLSPDRSYAGFCWVASLESGAALSGFCHVTLRDLSDNQLATESQSAEPNPRSGASVTLTAGAANRDVFARVQNPFGTQTINFVLLETTLASPWYFLSTPSGYDAFVEIRNQSTGSVSATVRAYNAAGVIAGSSAVAIPANGNIAVSVASLGISNASGSLTITHNGMPGSIVANATTLSGTTGLSFDAPFTPRMSWSMF